jgi:hypothetical protein
MLHRRLAAAALLAAIVTGAPSCARKDAAEWTLDIRPVAAPAGSNSSEPQLTVSGAGVILSWIERAGATTTLKFAERTRSGWTAPVRVASGDDWFVSYADPPAVTRLSDRTLVAEWLQQIDPRLEATNLQLSYSTDEGRTWAAPFTPHHDGTTTQHAFASMFELPGRSLGLVWLDGRDSLIETDDPAGGSMTMRYAAFDQGWKQIADAAIDRRVCECCSTSAAMTADGVLTAYRDRSGAEIRDIAVSRLTDGKWSEPQVVHADNWKIAACPVNGPALSARGRDAAAVWFTAKGDVGQVYAAFSSDAGRSWGAPVRVDAASSLGRVDVELLEPGAAVVSWIEFADNRTQLHARRVEASGARSPAISVGGLTDDRTSGLPRMAWNGSELVFAWTERAPGAAGDDAPLHLRTAVAPLPED